MNDTKTKTETYLSDKSIIIVLLLRIRNSGFSRILSSTTRDHFRAMFGFSYLENTWRDGNFLLRSLHVLTLRVCSKTLVSFLCLRFNSTATGHFREKKWKPQHS